ncbi:hypothetical protein PZBJ_23890 [Pantoea endophytica]|uniref:Uncharacterized protein n=1 Tax=Pantoea endophytica TaxID=92488 RepID=A0ABX4SN70_9GAMM|nr:hypothetical protein PZBJ_23890 [Pantoea endophytica]
MHRLVLFHEQATDFIYASLNLKLFNKIIQINIKIIITHVVLWISLTNTKFHIMEFKIKNHTKS